jgi:hypothetical protein
MLVSVGEKVHIVVKRSFETELRRHFVGEIMAAEGVITRIEGYAFVFDTTRNVFVKKPEKRTSIIDLAESGYLVNIIPVQVNIDDLVYKQSTQRTMIVTDDKGFSLEINEFGTNR